MEFPPPRRRETLPARLGTTPQYQAQPATVPGTTYATPPGLSYGSSVQPVYYAPVYPAGPSYGPRHETYITQPAFYPQQQVHYVQAVDPRADEDRLSTGPLPRSPRDEEVIRPRINETPRYRSPPPMAERAPESIKIKRRSDSRSHSKHARFADDEYFSDVDSSSSEERVFIRPYHDSSRGSGYTENDSSTVYSFSPTRASRAPSSSLTAKSGEEEGEKSESGSASQENGVSRVRATYVFESRYTGESRLGDPHTVKLSVQKTTAVKQKHLFRWIHTTRSSMNFDEFANIASQVPALDASERKAITQLLPRVKRKFVKTIQTSTGKDVQYMEPAVMPYRIPDDGKNRSIASRTAAWVCLPYFSLENYSGLLSAENSAEFPVQTLLQAQFSKTARERDMQQAVCQIGRRGSGRCFHIAQLWCLIIDKSLLLTYGRMTEDALCAESREAMTKITIENTMAQAKPRLIVSYRGSVVWAFLLEECQTWTDLLSHFREFWPKRLIFFMHRSPINAEDWPRIWLGAQRVGTNLAVDVDIGTDPKPPPRRLEPLVNGTQTSDNEGSTGKQQAGLKPSLEKSRKLSPEWKPDLSNRTNSIPRPEPVSIFSFLEGVPQPTGFDESTLNEHILEVEDFLLNQTNFTDRKAYRSCNPSSRNKVHGILEKRGFILSQSQDSSSRDQVDYEEDVDMFNTADIIFRFFFPADAKVATVGKFWGAVEFLIESQRENSPLPRKIRRQRSFISRITRSLTVTIASFNETIGYSTDPSHLDIVVPDDLKNAWLHLMMGLIFVPHDEVMSETLLVHAQLLIEEGIENIVKSLSRKSLMENAVISPIEICTLMGLKMLQDSTAGLPDISYTYSAYLESVAADISKKPSDRLHERRIGLLKQELSVIMKTLDAQHRIIENLEREFKPQVMRNEHMTSTDHPNIGYEYSRRWVEPLSRRERSRVRSSPRDYEVQVRPHMHDLEYARSEVHARSRYQDYDRENRTHAGFYNEDPYVYHTAAQSYPDFKLAPTDVGGFRKLFAEECFRHIERRKREFGEFRYQATLLEEENQNKVETTKDRQERAIYAFTIVTVIFLPLSSVASIFGINTKDVRDTDLGQWAYWATAVPVTAAVVFFGLLWTGELGNILRWVSSFGPHVRGGGYRWVPDGYNDMEPIIVPYRREEMVLRERERERLGGYLSRDPSPPPPPPPQAAFVRRREAVY